MKAKTLEIMNEMVAHARAGNEIIPMFWQPLMGISASVSAAIRAAKKQGLLVQSGLDGVGRPKYAAPLKSATHEAPATIQ